MSTQRSLTEEEQAELADLNAAVSAAIEARRAWLDAKMYEVSQLQPGDDIYDVYRGVRLGRIRELYRFQNNKHGGIYDTHLSCNYEYETHPGCFDNTSRQIGVTFGTQQDAIVYAERHLSAMRGLSR